MVVRCAALKVAAALSQFASHTARVPPEMTPPSSLKREQDAADYAVAARDQARTQPHQVLDRLDGACQVAARAAGLQPEGPVLARQRRAAARPPSRAWLARCSRDRAWPGTAVRTPGRGPTSARS